MKDEFVDRVAQAIFHNGYGLSDEEHEIATGVKRKLWETAAPWDTNPDELAEHERDDYRIMAQAAIEACAIKPIRTDDDHKAALREIESLWSAEPNTPAGDRLEVLGVLVERYEKKRYPIR